MELKTFFTLYDISGKVTVVTGGAGILCTTISRVLAAAGMKVAILDLNLPAAESLAAEIRSNGGEAISVACNVQEKSSVESAAQEVMGSFGQVDNLINGAGGNKPQATIHPDQSFFDLPIDEQRWVIDLNLIGTILPSQVFGQVMAQQKQGNIINISSMNAFRPLTRIPAYSAAKAAVSNFTQWLAVHMALEYSPDIRVNAIAPGFILTDQNRFLLTDKETGDLSPRGKSIIDHTPMRRFGTPDDLLGTVFWMISPASAFITGVVVPVDGGFSVYSGV
ncbi:MAG: SDR family oxidoreductase [Anaerolineales bacterium]|nr:SDR family oxidoreductase [Anaerolineales bacterium]